MPRRKSINKESRLDRWKNPKYFHSAYTWGNGDETEGDKKLIKLLGNRRTEFYENNKDKRIKDTELPYWSILQSAKEVIFDIVDNKPIFHIIIHSINVRRGEIEISHILDQLITDESEAEMSNEIRSTLATAHALDVPIYPNTETVAPILAQYYRELMLDGFSLETKGVKQKFKLVKSPGNKLESVEHFENINPNELLQPAELTIVRNAVLQEIKRRDHAARIIASLRLAIFELDKQLKSKKRNESSLQTCLTENPILFGTEYTKIIPKHCLGSEYEMDYALERASGLIDLVEIESSTLTLFNKKGNPSRHLIHAEQQVLDWLNWIERNHPYAREGLPGIMQPIGYIIIGRNQSLQLKDKERLKRRNILFKGSMEILTYDNLLDRAKNLLSILSGEDI